MSDWDDGMVDSGSYYDKIDELVEAEAEIAELRAALEEIASDLCSRSGQVDIARKALTKEGTGYTWCEVVHVSDTEGTRGHGFMALVPNSTLAKEGK